MKIWDLPKTEKEAISFSQDMGLLPITKQCVYGDKMTLYSTREKTLVESVTIGHV